MKQLPSWKDLHVELEKYSAEHDALFAKWDDYYQDGQWALEGGSPRTPRLFRETAARAWTKLGRPRGTGTMEPWQLWIEFLLDQGWRYPNDGKWSSDASERAGGWKTQKRLAEEGPRILPRVFQVSADCCQDLAERENSIEELDATARAQESIEVEVRTAYARRAAVEALISKVAAEGRKITRKDIWTVAGYKDATEFERFQRGDARTTRSAALAFNRVLDMVPIDFIQLLGRIQQPDKKPASK